MLKRGAGDLHTYLMELESPRGSLFVGKGAINLSTRSECSLASPSVPLSPPSFPNLLQPLRSGGEAPVCSLQGLLTCCPLFYRFHGKQIFRKYTFHIHHF